MQRLFLLGLANAVMFAVTSTSHGAATYSIDIDFSSNVVGTTETTKAYIILRESLSGSDPPELSLLSGSGVSGVALSVRRTQGDATMSNFQLSEGLSFFGVNPDPNPTLLADRIEFNSISAATFSGAGAGESLSQFVLGTFDVTTAGEGISSFAVGNLTNQPLVSPLGIGAPLGDSLEVAASAIMYGSATITAVPEPGSVAGLAALVIGGALVHRRRLRGRQAMRTPRNC